MSFAKISKIITYSRNVFIPLTNICRNNCGYCGYRRDITHPEARLLSVSEVDAILERGKRSMCTEALFTFGEKPGEVAGFSERLQEFGYNDILDYLVELCEHAIDFGLLPHSNPGVLDRDELIKLKPVNASMGLMLETTARIEAHEGCAGKEPALRLKTIEEAGRLKIPFTTGLLIGIGETMQDRIDSLIAIKELHEKYSHIQEVIIQNFAPKPATPMSDHPPPMLPDIINTVIAARRILPGDIAIQIPPNLIRPEELIKYGASDLGGISSETIDYINPETRWPDIEELKGLGYPLKERLPIYPAFVKRGWYSDKIKNLIINYSDTEGFRKSY